MKNIKRNIKHAQKQIYIISSAAIIRIFKSVLKPLSRLSVRVFESGSIRQIVGLIVITAVLALTIIPTSLASAQTAIYQNYATIQTPDALIETEKSLQLPVISFTITQGFSLLHPGIDLAAVKGSPVYPIMDGTVIEVEQGRLGYGNYVIIDHGSGFKSLYAHFAKIEAKTGEKVNKDSIVGLVGSTGWSTGPHLHLQIMEQNKWVNPRVFFESYFGQRLASK